jgi:salicylate hydroxylase
LWYQRADLIQILYDIAIPNVNLRLKASVTSIDASAPSCTLASGEVVPCDLIIGADGVKSMIREFVVGHVDKPVATGDAAYR